MIIIQTREQFLAARTAMLETTELVVDTETTWEKFLENKNEQSWDDRQLMGLAILCQLPSNPSYLMECYFPFRHSHDKSLFPNNNDNLPINWLKELECCFENSNTKIIGHGFKFDLQVLERERIDVAGQIWDTLLLSWMHNENKFSHELENLAVLVGEKKLGTESKKIAKELGGWNKIPPEMMGLYSLRDCKITWRLYHYFLSELQDREKYLDELYPREEQFLRLLAEIETRGIAVNTEIAKQLSQDAQQKLSQALLDFGYDPNKPSQLAHRLYSKPPEGLGFVPKGWSKRKSVEFASGYLPVMDAKTLSRIDHPEVKRILEYRSWMKGNSTYFGPWLYRTASDSRIHPTYRQHGTVTTRLSCEKPNMQQIPRDVVKSPVKKMLKSSSETELWEFDYSQIEFRLGCVYAEVQILLDAYEEGLDVHQLTADRIGIAEGRPDLTKDQCRYIGKQSNFLTIYGGGIEVLRMQLWRDARLEISESFAGQVLQDFHKTYPEFKRISNKCEQVARTRGYVKLWTGRRRHFTEIPWKCKDGFNSIIQGGAAEIVKESMLELSKAGFDIVAQVHDSVWIELPVDSVEDYKTKIQEIMEWASERFEIPFPIDAKRLA